jgi:hypothetical protein
VVFSKYRNLIALSSFYEYLMSGRCTSLEGTNGAYNLYEMEIRSNQIISQLSNVLNSLEQIKDNQYMAYTQLTSINNNLLELNTAMDTAVNSIEALSDNTEALAHTTQESSAYILSEIKRNSEMVAYNTAVSAFYSEKNADLTKSMLFLDTIKTIR